VRDFYVEEKYVKKEWINYQGRGFEESINKVDKETEESVYEKLSKALYDNEKKKEQEEMMRTNWYFLEIVGKNLRL
jgi:hypothetical protein